MKEDSDGTQSNGVMEMTGAIIAAYVGNNAISGSDLAQIIKSVHGTLAQLATGSPLTSENLKPAAPIKKSVTPDYIICLEDGRRLKMLKRYLRSRYKLSPDEYRRKWGLPADYPMVAPNYAERRSQFAKQIGLGRLPKTSPKRKRA